MAWHPYEVGGRKSRVYFARTAGRRATFVVSSNGTVEAYGPDAEKHPLEMLDYL